MAISDLIKVTKSKIKHYYDSQNVIQRGGGGERGYNIKFFKKNRSKYFFLKKIVPNS